MHQELPGAGAQDRICAYSGRKESAGEVSQSHGGPDSGHEGARRNGLHAAIIMDGNGRWAVERGLPRVAGHRAGADSVRRVVEAAPDLGISTLTLYALSEDNWT